MPMRQKQKTLKNLQSNHYILKKPKNVINDMIVAKKKKWYVY